MRPFFKINSGILGLAAMLALTGCFQQRTLKDLAGKRWYVVNVTPPDQGGFNIEQFDRARDLKNGFYQGAWFYFGKDSLFQACFQGTVDTGKYALGRNGKVISLFPKTGGSMYEQIEIQSISDSTFEFNTVISSFRMTLHLKSYPGDSLHESTSIQSHSKDHNP